MFVTCRNSSSKKPIAVQHRLPFLGSARLFLSKSYSRPIIFIIIADLCDDSKSEVIIFCKLANYLVDRNFLTARKNASVWRWDASCPKLTRTVPLSRVPALSCANGAQCSPARTAICCFASRSDASWQSIPGKKDTVPDWCSPEKTVNPSFCNPTAQFFACRCSRWKICSTPIRFT